MTATVGKEKMNKNTADGLKSTFIAAVIAFIGVVIISTLAYFVSAIWSAVFSSFSLTFLVMLIGVTITGNSSQQETLVNNIELTAVLYWVLALSMVLWFVLQKYAFQDMSWYKRMWVSWTIGNFSPWLVSVIILLALDYTVPSFHNRYVTSTTVKDVS